MYQKDTRAKLKLFQFFVIYIGTQDLDEKGIMIKWHGESRVKYWRDEGNGSQCNLVEGRDPGTWPTNLGTDTILNAFVGPLCRKLQFKYVRDVSRI